MEDYGGAFVPTPPSTLTITLFLDACHIMFSEKLPHPLSTGLPPSIYTPPQFHASSLLLLLVLFLHSEYVNCCRWCGERSGRATGSSRAMGVEAGVMVEMSLLNDLKIVPRALIPFSSTVFSIFKSNGGLHCPLPSCPSQS